AVVHGEDLGALVDNDLVLSVSIDAVVRADVPSGLVGDAVNPVAHSQSSDRADTSELTVAPVALRQTLGLGNSRWTGRGVGVAVIDSGLEMSEEFSGRVTAFFDFTTGGIVPS